MIIDPVPLQRKVSGFDSQIIKGKYFSSYSIDKQRRNVQEFRNLAERAEYEKNAY